MTLRIGLSAYDIPATDLVDLAVAADQLGYASLWLGEHIVRPCGYASQHPTAGGTAHQHHQGPIIDVSTSLLDPLVALSACAAVTERLLVATGIFILPLRHPLLTARMTATLQEVSRGRLMLGVGAGWLREEFDALGVAFDDRGPLMDETIDVLRHSWSGEPFSHDGAHFSFAAVQMAPEPIAVPLILGGNTESALRRAASKGDGWFASGTPPFDEAARLRDRVLALRDAQCRTTPFSVLARLSAPEERDRYESAGFEHVLVWADQVWPRDAPLEDKRDTLARAAERLELSPT
jgi:probable F420-dependent oxidoreductase